MLSDHPPFQASRRGIRAATSQLMQVGQCSRIMTLCATRSSQGAPVTHRSSGCICVRSACYGMIYRLEGNKGDKAGVKHGVAARIRLHIPAACQKPMGPAHNSSAGCLQSEGSVARLTTTQSSPFQQHCYCPCCRCMQRVHAMSHARCAMKPWRQGQRCWRCPASTATMRGASPPG